MNEVIDSKTNSQRQNGDEAVEYVEVLGDTVLGKHMIISIIVSVFLGLGGFLLGKEIFPKIAKENMVNSYSLLLGIAGLVVALFINTALFKPKRELVEEDSSVEKISEVFDEYKFDIEEERKVIKNDPTLEKEMKEQGIYLMFFNEKESEK